jgi:tRNA nucleotidyltransferase (CCA-adding enzyme)
MKKIEQGVLKSSKPTSEEMKKASKTVKQFLEKLKPLKAEVGGSFARGTWLTPLVDVDVFVKFDPKKHKSDQLSEKLEKILKKKFEDIVRVHGSRDYFQIPIEGTTFEIIPVLDINNPKSAQNMTDVSPLHVRWLSKKTSDVIKDEMRLAKQFCKANGCYGAESYINGFSGYVLEILLVHYKSFSSLVKAALKWDEKTIIDVEKHYTHKEALVRLNESKIQSPLIVVDPVWPERNAAAALSLETFEKFKKACSRYLKKPHERLFQVKKFDLKKEIRNYKAKNIAVLELVPHEGNPDIEGTKMLKVFQKICRKLKEAEFEIVKSGWNWEEKATLWFIVDKGVLSKTKKHYGPPKNLEDRLKDFKKKWKGKPLKFEKSYSYVVIDRKFNKLNEFISDVVKDEFVKERVKKIRSVNI